jgi:hypothetical protein
MSVRDRDDLVVARLHELAPHLDGEPDPAWQATTRARLVAMAAVRSPEPAPVSPVRRFLSRAEDAAPSRWRGRLTAGLAGAAMAVTALATLVAVSTGAGPGDPLYGLKRGTEQTQLALAGDARGQTLLDFARTRLHELEELTGSSVSALPAAGGAGPDGTVVLAADADPRLVLETLATMDAQTAEGAAWLTEHAVDTGDDAPLDLLAAWTQDQSEGLAALRDGVPDATVDELDGSLNRLSEISARTVGLRDVLDCPAGVPVESTDAYGPLPGLCLPGDPAAVPPTGGEEGPGSVPAPGQGSGATATTTPAGPGGGTSTGDSQQSGGGEGGTLPAPPVPGGEQPPVTTPRLPAPLPLPTGGLPLPSGLPGGTTSSGSSTGSTTSPSLPLDIEICLPPLVLGNCSD